MENPNLELAQKIAQEARESLSPYCLNICKAKCCKFGKLLLQDDDEVNTISGTDIDKHVKLGVLESTSNGFATYDLEKSPCRHLVNNVFCNIHASNLKPKICNDYPLFLTKQFVIASQQCPAVSKGELDKYIQKIKELGFKKF